MADRLQRDADETVLPVQLAGLVVLGVDEEQRYRPSLVTLAAQTAHIDLLIARIGMLSAAPSRVKVRPMDEGSIEAVWRMEVSVLPS